MRLLVVEGRTYLEGWCRRAEAVRLFRLDRVLGLEVLDVAAEVPPEAEPEDVDQGLFRPSAGRPQRGHRAVPARPLGGRVLPVRAASRSWATGGCGSRCAPRTPGWVRRLALRLGENGRIVAPASLAAQVREDAAAALAQYA